MKADARIGVIHFDAHYDLCSQYDGHRWSHACTEARALESVITGRDLTFVGIRVAELDELKTLEKNPAIKTIRAVDVYREGPQDENPETDFYSRLFACMNAKKQYLEIRGLLEQVAAQFEQ